MLNSIDFLITETLVEPSTSTSRIALKRAKANPRKRFLFKGVNQMNVFVQKASAIILSTKIVLLPTLLILILSSCGGGGGTTPASSTADTTPPVITLSGDASIAHEQGTTYSDEGATATDNVDGNVNIVVSGAVDEASAAIYTLTYSASDNAGNSSTAIRTVVVADTLAPVLTLNGDAIVIIEQKTVFSDPGATATDSVDGSLEVAVSGVVGSAVGDYTLAYTATDAAGNAASMDRMVTVILDGDAVTTNCGVVADSSVYQIANPEGTIIFGDPMLNLCYSDHFIVRATYDNADLLKEHLAPGKYLSEDNQAALLRRAEEIWAFFINDMGFTPPYENQDTRYKVNLAITDYGYLSGGTFDGASEGWPAGKHPHVQMLYSATQGYGGLAHEFTHALQNMVNKADWSEFGGWFSESHAEFMAYQFNGMGYGDAEVLGCSSRFVNAPHQYYGTTRNRYCNWLFFDFLAQEQGYDAVNKLWSASVNSPDFEFDGYLGDSIPSQCGEIDGPFATLLRVLDWDIAQLNDLFGRWAMANIAWDYDQKGVALKEKFGTPSKDISTIDGGWGRMTRLEVLDAEKRQYGSPDLLSPARWGYNSIQLFPDDGAQSIDIEFRGIIQEQSARTEPFGNFNKEPSYIPNPNSGWRWGVVAVDGSGKSRHSALQSTSFGSLTFGLMADDVEIYLVVLAAPTELEQIRWDQMFYSVYRYPYRIQLNGAVPYGHEPVVFPSVPGGRHSNGGGFVADTATVSGSAYVGPEAMVLDVANVTENARIEGRAVIRGQAKVFGQAVVKDHAQVDRQSRIYGNALVRDSAQINEAYIHGNAEIGGISWLVDGTEVKGNAKILSTNIERAIHPRSIIGGNTQLLGDVEHSVEEMTGSTGIWYGFVHPEFMDDPLWGSERTEPEPEVTLSIESIGWDDGPFEASTVPNSHDQQLRECIAKRETQSSADLNGHFSSLDSAFGDHSTTDVTILSGPYDDPLLRGGTGDQWTLTDGVYQFKISIEHSSEFNLSIDTLIERIEELPGPYIRALAEVSDPNEDGIAIYYDLDGAAAHGGKSYINMVPGAGSWIIAHEAGHTLEQVATQDDPTIPVQWQEAIASDNISVSGYGNGSWWEDAGEFSRIYALCLDGSQRPIVPMFGELAPLEELHRLSPERFDLWESMLYPAP